ncbi:membrane protein [Nocardioides ginsengisoli]|uniref:Integral membrane protein n=1 Tax=Nocardioides ginsengisoli TaxID=363868 RepID=A0ABW3W051_9ACTN
MPDVPGASGAEGAGERGEVAALSHGWGRALVFVYGLFAVAATGRSAVQLGLEPGKAPLAYSLSLVAAVLYLVATTCLLLGGRTGWRIAGIAVTIELLGVLSVGTLSYLATDLFPDKTVWSHFGQGYGFLPLVLPVAGLVWLRHTSPTAT